MIAGPARLRAQPAADREPVLAGQHQVEHDQVEALLRERLVHRRTIGNGAHGETLLAEVAHHQVAQALVVVDDQNPGLELSHAMILVVCPGAAVSLCCQKPHVLTNCYKFRGKREV